ncbi:hypothetical protein [Methanobrevibacter arboriphilus]|nr:hypothetical protein [Methanobrevibacter arboriphilus]
MEDIAEKFIENGYKIMSADSEHIIAKKKKLWNYLYTFTITIPYFIRC